MAFKKILGGSMAAATLAGAAVVAQAPAASAASDWDRLAQCESGGNWSINTGNGYYGGLQFSLQSWQAVGGSGYPHQASKEEQINRASKLQAIQGWGAWPACSARLGLSGTPSAAPAPAQNQQQSAPAPAAPAPQPAPQQAAPAPQQSAPAPAPQQSAPAPQPQTEQPRNLAPAYSAEPNTSVEVSEETYTVQSGDSLSSIAAELGVEWTDLWGANQDLVEDPNLIYVGDELKLPVI